MIGLPIALSFLNQKISFIDDVKHFHLNRPHCVGVRRLGNIDRVGRVNHEHAAVLRNFAARARRSANN